MGWLMPVSLTGQRAALVPLEQDHCAGLITAASDGALWRIWYTGVPAPDAMEAEVVHRLRQREDGKMLPFTVIDVATGQIVGMTSFGHVDPVVRRLEIGWSWYARTTQRSGLNTDAKRLLLTHAFETLGCVAVELRTHFMNQQSRRAIERLGAKLDGVLRQHALAKDGTLRDTCVYSVIAAEWPAVRAHLEWLSGRYDTVAGT